MMDKGLSVCDRDDMYVVPPPLAASLRLWQALLWVMVDIPVEAGKPHNECHTICASARKISRRWQRKCWPFLAHSLWSGNLMAHSKLLYQFRLLLNIYSHIICTLEWELSICGSMDTCGHSLCQVHRERYNTKISGMQARKTKACRLDKCVVEQGSRMIYEIKLETKRGRWSLCQIHESTPLFKDSNTIFTFHYRPFHRNEAIKSPNNSGLPTLRWHH